MDHRSLAQAVSLLGAGLVLVAFAANQMGRLDQRAYPYLLLNLAGGAILTVFAVRARDPGLILMEGSWVVISAGGMLLAWRRGSKTGNGKGEISGNGKRKTGNDESRFG